MSLGILAKWVEANGKTKAWLLGMQPESVKFSPQLTATAKRTMEVLGDLLRSLQPASSLATGG
jgi:hypothetical protein